MFIDVQADTSVPESESKDHVYWCVQTQTCLGPDGQIVDEETCNPYRSCYQAI